MSNSYLIGGGIILLAIIGTVVGLGMQSMSTPADSHTTGPQVTIAKDPNCGCCEAYASYLRDADYRVTVNNRSDMQQVKAVHGVPADMTSCHTAEVAGYTVEGHIPHEVIETLLDEKPSVDGIALAGMPAGSPGMPGVKQDSFHIQTLEGETFTRY